jgi:CheY-like chemotaxis protein
LDLPMPQGTSVTTAPAFLDGLTPYPAPRLGAILVVEDRDDVRHGLAELLELNGYVAFEAANANEAFGHLESSPHGIALILLDLVLPGRGGAEIRAVQLADPEISSIPIIVVSANSPAPADEAALQAAAWLEKPFRCEQLLTEVRKHVSQ